MSDRSSEAMQAEAIVQAEVERFATGQQTLSAVPAIVLLQQSMEELRQAEFGACRASCSRFRQSSAVRWRR